MKKNKIKIFIIITLLIINIFFVTAVLAAAPAGISGNNSGCPNGQYCFNVPIGTRTSIPIGGNPFGDYFKLWYGFILGTIGILATVMIIIGGFQWLVSRGNTSQVKEGQDRIFAALTGLALAFLAYTILYLINPQLTSINFHSGLLTAINYQDQAPTSPNASNFQHLEEGTGNILPPESEANTATSRLLLDCQQNTPYLNCDTMIEIYDYQEFQGTYEYKLKGNEDLAKFLIEQGRPSPAQPELLQRQGIAAQVIYDGAAYTLYGNEPGQRYWQVIKFGNLP